MVDQYYALREFALLREKSESLSLYALVDGIQFDRFFNESLKEDKGIRSLFCLPEDKILAFAGPWLLNVSKLSGDHLVKISQLEEKYPAVSWIISEQPFVTLARHLELSLMVSLPTKEKGLFRFYDCRVLKRLPELLSSGQVAELMKYSQRWFFLSEGEINCYQYDAGMLGCCIIRNNELSRDVL
ncbi:DUF4123 domain-containing protein [Klebsiella grimontii]|uniref:DUF4123 domain-containing protein n=1 Tax=Klebsiella grimontii TaxID=2058152 RepID=UPI0025A07FFF|nr:DUF4123 domain-containing protein [Klebsiella grimontii]MDM6723708.1 DUF4123 domain-containing protein [Klebsiella grimontii]MDM7223320.1 DUF4123 domain-containing protein [Klebsiella grimontii]MDM7237826.1 DUF4123 domain-containing protein [Klebsiella grimontii]MDM7253347.1 DUF4123 domain-containing protein [Klebsiella grimontii]